MKGWVWGEVRKAGINGGSQVRGGGVLSALGVYYQPYCIVIICSRSVDAHKTLDCT